MGAREVVLADELLEAVGTLRRRIRGGVGRPWPASDLTASEVDLVRLLRRRPDLGVAQAAAELGLAANSVSTLVRRLSDAGVVVRETDPADGRAARLRLGDEAQQRVEAWRDQRVSYLADAVAALDDDDRERLDAAIPAIRRLVEVLG